MTLRYPVDWLLLFVGKGLVYLVVLGVASLMVLPFYWMLITAVMPAADILSFPPKFFPDRLTLDHFSEAFHKAPWVRYYLNSFIVAILSVGLSLFLGLFAAYAFAVYQFPLQHFFFVLILSTIMIPVQVTSVALYVLVAQLQWVDTFLGILAPNFASAFAVFLLRQHMQSIPIDLIDAARIDGAGEVRIVLTIITPLLRTTIATVGLILFLNSWNDFLWPVVVINSEIMRTIPIGIALFKDPYGNVNYGPLMAATVISTVPMLIAYFCTQKHVVRGIAMTGIKG
jgi:multiple sugar transport system permease protein/sn-glycerol 3-phosphate transport system permease protein